MPILNTLYKRQFDITEKITIFVPTVGEILNDEDNYMSILSVLTGHPSDYMVALDDSGIDFSEIDDFGLLLTMFRGIAERDTTLFFGKLDLSHFRPMLNNENGNIILYDPINDITIDKRIHAKIAATLRNMFNLENKPVIPGNEEAKKYLIERARKKMLRRRGRSEASELESLIISLVNTEQYKYNYETTLDLPVLQFYKSVHQIIKKDAYDKRMIGVYAGTVNTKEMKPEDLSWLSA